MALPTAILNVNVDNIHKLDTANAQSLHGMWSAFSKCADYLQQGRRLENLSWRLWARETFCVEPQISTKASALLKSDPKAGDHQGSSDSVELAVPDHAKCIDLRKGERQIRSPDLQGIVSNIQSKRSLERIGTIEPAAPVADITPCGSTPTPTPTFPISTFGHGRVCPYLEFQSSKFPGRHSTTAHEKDNSATAQLKGSDTSIDSSIIPPVCPGVAKSPSIVRGFSPSLISSFCRARPDLVTKPSPSQPIAHLKPSPRKIQEGVFTMGKSFDEDDASSFGKRTLAKPTQETATDGLLQPITSPLSPSAKFASFIDEGAFRHKGPSTCDENIVDGDDSDWEDFFTDSDTSSVDGRLEPFPRVNSSPSLVSRRSLLTMMMYQANNMRRGRTSPSRPGIRTTRLTSSNGILVHGLPLVSDDEKNLKMCNTNTPRSDMNSPPPPSVAYSPRTARRNMLATELPEELRGELVWERQQKSATANAYMKRRPTAYDVNNIKYYHGTKGPHQFPGQVTLVEGNEPQGNEVSTNGLWMDYLPDYGPWEYHAKGW